MAQTSMIPGDKAVQRMAGYVRSKIWRGLEKLGYTAIIESRASGRSVVSFDSLGAMVQCALEQSTFVQDIIAEEVEKFSEGEVKAAVAEELAATAYSIVQKLTGGQVLATMNTDVAIVAVADHRRFRMSLPLDRPGWVTTVPHNKKNAKSVLLTSEDLSIAQKARALALGKKKIELRGGIVGNAALGVKAPEFPTRSIAALGLRFRDIYFNSVPSPTKIKHKDGILWRLQAVFTEEFPNLQGHLGFFGSAANGLEIKTSDVNFTLRINWSNVAESIAEPPNVEVLAKALTRRGYKEVFVIQARVPTCWFRDTDSGLSCSVNFGDNLGVANSELLRAYGDYDARVPRLICLLKLWARERQIGDVSKGGLTGYALSLMAINFLQVKGVLPCLQDHQNSTNEDLLVVAKQTAVHTFEGRSWAHKNVFVKPDEQEPYRHDPTVYLANISFDRTQKSSPLSSDQVWIGTNSVPVLFFEFLSYYGWDFRFADREVPSVRTGRVLQELPTDLGAHTAGRGPQLVVEDPFQSDRNAAATLKDLTQFVNEVRRGANVLTARPTTEQRSVEHVVEELFRPKLGDLRKCGKAAAKAALANPLFGEHPKTYCPDYEVVGFDTLEELERAGRPITRDWSQPRRTRSETRQSPVRLSTLLTASIDMTTEKTIPSAESPLKEARGTPVLRLSDILFTWDLGADDTAAPSAEMVDRARTPVEQDKPAIAPRMQPKQRPASFHEYGRVEQEYSAIMDRRHPHERAPTPFGQYERMDEGYDMIMAYGQSYERPLIFGERGPMDVDSLTSVTRDEYYERPVSFGGAHSPINYCEPTIVTPGKSYERHISVSSGEHAPTTHVVSRERPISVSSGENAPMDANRYPRIVTHSELREHPISFGDSSNPAQQPARKRHRGPNNKRGSRGGRGSRGRKPTGGNGDGGRGANDTDRDFNRSWRRSDNGGTGSGGPARTSGDSGRVSAGEGHARPGGGDGRVSAGGGHARPGGGDGRVSAGGGHAHSSSGDGRVNASGGGHARSSDGRVSASGGGHARSSSGGDGRANASGGGGRVSRNARR
ncbi:Zinc finger, CCHC domain-containing protein [Geranomyces variabilis]|nr:Zinc finger, CCHC domain-containing protein [Geranomyces variabilis]